MPLLLVVLILAHTSCHMAQQRTLLNSLVPAPPQFSIVYDGGAGYDPGSTGATSVGQYADTNTNTVHTTRGYGRRAIAQDIGQIFGYSVLQPGDRHYFSKLLGTDPGRWENLHGANPQGAGGVTGDEAFADYYALAATGGLKPGQAMSWGDVSVDPSLIPKFAAAVNRLGARRGLQPLNLAQTLASAG